MRIFCLLIIVISSCSSRTSYRVFVKNNLRGVVSSKGDTIITAKYAYIHPALISNRAFFVADNYHSRILDFKNNSIFDTTYDVARLSKNRFFVITRNDSSGLINQQFKLIVPPQYKHISLLNENLFMCQKNDYWGVIDTNNKIIIPFEYSYINFKIEKYIKVKKHQYEGLYDLSGKLILPLEYDRIQGESFCEDLIAVEKKGKWGFVNDKNECIIPFTYRYAENFSEGLAKVFNDSNLYGFINIKNEIKIPFMYSYPRISGRKYDLSNGFENSKAFVGFKNKTNIIDKQNKQMLEQRYNVLGELSKGYRYVELGKMSQEKYLKNYETIYYGYIDSNSKELLVRKLNYDTINWNISKAPKTLPDYSYIFKNYSLIKYESELYSEMYSVATIFNKEAFNNKYPRYSDEELGYQAVRSDSFYKTMEERMREFSHNDTSIWDMINNKHYSKKEFDSINNTISIRNQKKTENAPSWTLESILTRVLINICQTSETNTDLDFVQIAFIHNLFQIEYILETRTSDRVYHNLVYFDSFKRKTVFAILSSEQLRRVAWDWIKPSLKKAFQTIHPFHKKAYQDLFADIQVYIINYDLKRTKKYLLENEPLFAFQDINGNADPRRKLFAFIDRMILVHHLISLKDMQRWIIELNQEIRTW